MKRLYPLLVLLLALAAPSAASQEHNIPGFGEGNAVSLNQEYYLGRAWLMSFRRQAPILDDALLQDYVETLVFRLAETSQLRERRLVIVLVDNQTINAFAVPGGIVGVHSGLIAKAESEAQFSSVLTHELAHLSQRHFARGLESHKKSSAATMAGLLGGLVAIAAGAPDVGMGAIMGGQAAAMNSQLSYSRQHEQEADRVGMQNQVSAGLDPGGAAGMFTVMQRESRNYGARPPEFLLTHPLTESRIADAKNRAATYPKRMYEDSREFQLMRARVELSFIDSDEEAVAHFRRSRAEGGRQAVSAQYGLILALTRSGQFGEAQYGSAIGMLEGKLSLSPGNHPLTMSLASAYDLGGYYSKADKLLSRHVRRHYNNAAIWYQLAEVQGKAGNILGLHQSRAEYFALNGAMKPAIEQLNLALPLAKHPVTTERIHTRIEYFQNVDRALRGMRG
jgi:predicted Zn-dependent protease